VKKKKITPFGGFRFFTTTTTIECFMRGDAPATPCNHRIGGASCQQIPIEQQQ
jgi:hypothetical protein